MRVGIRARVLIGVIALLCCAAVLVAIHSGQARTIAYAERVVSEASTTPPSVPPDLIAASEEISARGHSVSTGDQGAPASVDLDLPSVEDVLRQYWGARWSEVEPKLTNRISMSTKMDMKLPPWEEIEPQVCEKLKFSADDFKRYQSIYLPPTPITVDFLTTMFPRLDRSPWTASDVTSLEAELYDSRRECMDSIESFRQVVDTALAIRCISGRYDHMPITNIDAQYRSRDSVYVTGFAISGWVISCGVGPSDMAEIGIAESGMKHCKLKWRSEIEKFSARKF